MIPAMQLREGLIRDETTFEVTSFEFADSLGETLRKDTRCVMEKYWDEMVDSLPKLESPTKNACHMVPLELPELQRQSNRLSSARLIRPANALYEVQVFLRKEDNGNVRLCVDNRVLKQVQMEGPTLGSVGVTGPIEAHVDVSDYTLDYVLCRMDTPSYMRVKSRVLHKRVIRCLRKRHFKLEQI